MWNLFLLCSISFFNVPLREFINRSWSIDLYDFQEFMLFLLFLYMFSWKKSGRKSHWQTKFTCKTDIKTSIHKKWWSDWNFKINFLNKSSSAYFPVLKFSKLKIFILITVISSKNMLVKQNVLCKCYVLMQYGYMFSIYLPVIEYD